MDWLDEWRAEMRQAGGDAFDGVCAHRFVMEQRHDGDPCLGCPEKKAHGAEWKCPFGYGDAQELDRLDDPRGEEVF